MAIGLRRRAGEGKPTPRLAPCSRRRLLAGAAVAALLALLAPAASLAQNASPAVALELARGERLVIEHDPFRIALLGRDGEELVATVAGLQGVPARVPGIDGPQPLEPLGPLGGFPAAGFVAGASLGQTFPIAVPFFTGNRLFGAEVGALVALRSVERVAGRSRRAIELEIETTAVGFGPATLRARRLPGGGASVAIEPPDGLPAISSMLTLASPPGEGLYGGGGRKDAFDQRGLLRNVWVEQQNTGPGPFAPVTDNDPTGTLGPTYTFPNGPQATHYPQAVLFGGRGWAVWVPDPALQRIDLAHSREDAVRWGVARPRIELRLAGGGDLEAASRAFTADNGRGPPPPRYAYLPWISVLNEGEGEAAPHGAGFEGGERVKRDVLEIVRRARRHDLPIGVIGMEGWHRVPGIERFAQRLRSQGFRLQAYWSPFINESAPVFEQARDRGYLVRDALGGPFPIITTRGNVNYLVDFTNPEARRWWGDLIAWPLELGFEAFMNDFGELVTEGMVFHSGEPPDVVHNAYPVLYHRATRAGVERFARANPQSKPFFYVRAGFSGLGDGPGVAASTPSVFPGDETTDWHRGFGLPSIVPMMLNLALGGSYAFTTDIGGYLDLITPRPDAELFTRWYQAAAFMPIAREHNATFGGSVRAWDFGHETLATYRRYARAKVRLAGLVDEWSRRAARDGTIGPVRPLVLDDGSPEARSIADQWLLGDDLLVAPVLVEGARERDVYLPRGARWERATVGRSGRLRPTGEVRRGGRTITVPAPLEDIPVFLRRARAGQPGPPPRSGRAPRAQAPRGPKPGSEARRAGEARGAQGPDSVAAGPASASPATRGAPSAAVEGAARGGLPFTGLEPGPLAALAALLALTGAALRFGIRVIRGY